MKKILLLFIIIFCVIGFVSCKGKSDTDIWSDALYKEDTVFGSGGKCITTDIVAQDKTVVFTINTDAQTLSDALMENSLISGENGAYGLYIKSVNGIVADFDVNGAYWSITKDGEYVSVGADSIKISNNDHYELTYTKG